jgi:hypothetical protein
MNKLRKNKKALRDVFVNVCGGEIINIVLILIGIENEM